MSAKARREANAAARAMRAAAPGYRDQIVSQIAETEIEYEEAKAHTYRCEGALKTLQHMLAQLDAVPAASLPSAPEPGASDPPSDAQPKVEPPDGSAP